MYIKITHKTFTKGKPRPPWRPITPVPREERKIIQKEIPKEEKPDTKDKIIPKEPKFCYIPEPPKFNEYGLYLIAEHIFRKPSFIDGLNLLVFLYFSSLNLYICFALLAFMNRDTVKNTFLLTNVFHYVTEIYLTRDMNHVVLKYYLPPLYRMYNVKDIRLLNKAEFGDTYHGQFAIVMIGHKKVYIPIDIIIHNKELFSAIFQGYEIKVYNDNGKANYIKLKSNDKVNYI
jgi:hypothetical protein